MKHPTTLPTDSIAYHPMLESLPGLWADSSPELAGLVEDVEAHGIHEPLIVVKDPDNTDFVLLIDGRHRLRAAQLGGIESVPVIFRDEADAADIILSTLVHRRHYTKGALAYLTYPVIASQAANRGGDKKSKFTQSTLIPSVEELCAKLGFSREIYFQAKQIHGYFKANPSLRAEYEPRILTGEIGLGACAAGLAGKEATQGQKRTDRGPLDLIHDAFRSVQLRFEYWGQLDRTAQHAVTQEATETFLKLPAEVQESVLKALKGARK